MWNHVRYYFRTSTLKKYRSITKAQYPMVILSVLSYDTRQICKYSTMYHSHLSATVAVCTVDSREER